MSARNARHALQVLREQPFDVVLTDLKMPDMNGIEAAIRIRQILPACKILLFSGQAATADLLEKARAQLLTGPCRSPLALANGLLYGRDAKKLVCWKLKP